MANDEYSVSAVGDLDTVMSEVGCQLFESGAGSDEMQAAFAFAAVDLVKMDHDDMGAADAHLTKLLNIMRAYLQSSYAN